LDVILRTKLSLKRVERSPNASAENGWCSAKPRSRLVPAATRREAGRPPAGVKPPQVAAVLADGGRLQLRDAAPDATYHWQEYKGGVLDSLASDVSEHDPCPKVPEVFLQRERIDKLTREITSLAARPETSPTETDVPSAAIPDTRETALIPPEELPWAGYQPPQVIDRDVVSSRRDSRTFGSQLAACAWSLGFFGASRKAWIGDGQNWLWIEWDGTSSRMGSSPFWTSFMPGPTSTPPPWKTAR
jgi:hypothetical protein